MKIKKLWIPSLIMFIIGGAAKLCDTLFNQTEGGFFLNTQVCNGIFVISLILLVIIAAFMSASDRKLEIKSKPTKSLAWIFGFITSVAVTGSGVISLLSIKSSDSLWRTLLTCLLGILGGIVLLYESCISFTGHNGMKKLSVLALAPSAWGCIRLINLFIEYSTVSINATEMYDVISVSLLVLFLYYQGAYFGEIKNPSTARRTVLYGTLFVVCGLITTADIIIKIFRPEISTDGIDTFVVTPTVSRILFCTADLAFCGYAGFLCASILRSADVNAPVLDEKEDEDTKFFGQLSTVGRSNADSPSVLPEEKKEASDEKTDSSGSVRFLGSRIRLDINDDIKQEQAPAEEAAGEKISEKAIGPEIEEPKTEEKNLIEEETKIKEEPQTEEEPKIEEKTFDKRENAIPEPVEEPTAEIPEENKSDISENEQPEGSSIPEIPDYYDTEYDRSDEDYDEIFRLLDELSDDE